MTSRNYDWSLASLSNHIIYHSSPNSLFSYLWPICVCMCCSLLPYLEYTSLVLKVYLCLVFQVSIHVASSKRYYFNAVVLNWGWFLSPRDLATFRDFFLVFAILFLKNCRECHEAYRILIAQPGIAPHSLKPLTLNGNKESTSGPSGKPWDISIITGRVLTGI